MANFKSCNKYIHAPFLALAVAAGVTVSAAAATETLLPVLVSATRFEQSAVTTPATISVIDRDTIEASGARHISEVLRGQGGIQINDTFGDGSRVQVDMRGFSSSANANVLVLVDGRRLNNTDISSPDFNSIALKDVERIEIIQGSAGTLFGDQAVGGVINIITRRADQLRFDVSADLGSYQHRGLRSTLANRLENGFGFRLSGERFVTNNYRDNNKQIYRNVLARFDYEHANGSLFFDHQDVSEDLRLAGRLTSADLTANSNRRQTVRPNDFSNFDTRISRAGLHQDLTANWSFEAEITRRKSKGFSNLIFFGAPSQTPQLRRHRSINPRLLGTFALPEGDALVTLGYDYDRADYSTTNTLFGLTTTQSNKQTIEGYYAQAVVPVTRKLELTVGARWSDYESLLRHSTSFPAGVELEDTGLSPEIGISFRPLAAWRLFLRRDENFRVAKVDENTFTSPGVIGLKTQTGVSWESGAEWQGVGRSARLQLWRLDLENEIAFDPTAADPFGTFFGANVNFAATRRTGLTFSGDMAVRPWLTISGSLAWIDPEFRSGTFTGKEISGVSRTLGNLTVNSRIDRHWSAFVDWNYTGRQYLSGDNSNSLAKRGSYSVMNARLAYRYDNWGASLRVNNLLDRSYNEVENSFGALFPSPERNVLLTIDYRLD